MLDPEQGLHILSELLSWHQSNLTSEKARDDPHYRLAIHYIFAIFVLRLFNFNRAQASKSQAIGRVQALCFHFFQSSDVEKDAFWSNKTLAQKNRAKVFDVYTKILGAISVVNFPPVVKAFFSEITAVSVKSKKSLRPILGIKDISIPFDETGISFMKKLIQLHDLTTRNEVKYGISTMLLHVGRKIRGGALEGSLVIPEQQAKENWCDSLSVRDQPQKITI